MPLWIPFYSRKRQRSQSLKREERPRKRHAGNTGNNTLTEITPQTTITSLPIEILTEIFELAVPPDHFLRARAMSTATGVYRPKPHNAWRESMAIKLAIPSVCRSWCSIGRRLLYQDITILDLIALHVLWAAFSSNRPLAGHVRSLKFMVYLNGKRPRRDEPSIRTIGQLIQCCPRLQRLDLLPYGGSYPPSPSSSDALAFPTLPRTVTSLSLGSHVRIWDFGTVILRHSASHLKELRIPFAALAGTEFVALPLSLPNLHTLEITCNGVSVGPTPTEQPRARWDMPQLRRVTFRQRDSLAGYPLDLYPEYAYVLALYGARLKYLHLPDCGFDVGAHHVEPEWEYGALLAMCPALEHVVLPAMALAEICDEKMSFPSVKLIDVWCHGACPVGERTVNRVHWPNVRAIHRLDLGLRDFVLELPLALDPRLEGEWRKMDVVPGLRLGRRAVGCDGVVDVFDRRRLHEYDPDRVEVQSGADCSLGADGGAPLGLMELDASDSSNSDETSLNSDSDLDAEREVEGELEDHEPQPMLGPALRRFLRATMPRRMFTRLERAVLRAVSPSG